MFSIHRRSIVIVSSIIDTVVVIIVMDNSAISLCHNSPHVFTLLTPLRLYCYLIVANAALDVYSCFLRLSQAPLSAVPEVDLGPTGEELLQALEAPHRPQCCMRRLHLAPHISGSLC